MGTTLIKMFGEQARDAGLSLTLSMRRDNSAKHDGKAARTKFSVKAHRRLLIDDADFK